MPELDATSEHRLAEQQANQGFAANRVTTSVVVRKNRAVAAAPRATRASRRRRSCSWASRQR